MQPPNNRLIRNSYKKPRSLVLILGFNTWLLLVIIAAILLGISIIIINLNNKQQQAAKWQLLQAQQASVNALSVATQLLSKNLLPNGCINTPQCAFWSGNGNIHLTKNNLPNKSWWHANGYPIANSSNNARFIVIQKPNNLYKIIAFAEDELSKQAVINTVYLIT